MGFISSCRADQHAAFSLPSMNIRYSRRVEGSDEGAEPQAVGGNDWVRSGRDQLLLPLVAEK
jgi:hypothetical protein